MFEADDEILDDRKILPGHQPDLVRSGREREILLIGRDKAGERAGEIGPFVLRIFDGKHVGELQLIVKIDVFLIGMLWRDGRQIVVHARAGEDDAPASAVRGGLEVLPPKLRILRRGLQQFYPNPFGFGVVKTGGRGIVEAFVAEIVAHHVDGAEFLRGDGVSGVAGEGGRQGAVINVFEPIMLLSQ